MKNKKLIMMIGIILLLIAATVAATYAYFTANMDTSETETTITVTGGTMTILYAQGKNINISNVYPKDGALDTKTFTVTGNNTTGGNMYYNLSLVVESNTFSNGALVYSFSGSKTESTGTVAATKTNQSIAKGAQNISLGSGSFVGAGSTVVHSYILTMYFPNNATASQNSEQSQLFKAHIGIQAANA